MKRRQFLQGIARLGTLASIGTLSQLSFIRQAMAITPAFGDYKALVCLFLHGGNDSFNMLVPTGSTANSGHADYASVRGTLAVALNDLGLASITTTAGDLNSGVLGAGSANPYYVDGTEQAAYVKGLYDLSASNGIALGVNGVMPELAQLITDNKASIIANTGALVSPVTRDAAIAGTAELPFFLFAHDQQQRALKTGYAHTLGDIGWAGRIADNWDGINNNSQLGLNISLSGADRFLSGEATQPLVLQPGPPPQYRGMVKGASSADDDRRALFQALAGKINSSLMGNLAFHVGNTYATLDPFKHLYGRELIKSLNTFDQLNGAWVNHPVNYTSTGPYGEALFSIPNPSTLGFGRQLNGSLISQLETVAKMVDMGARDAFTTGAYHRQIFYVELGGWDTHLGQAILHPIRLRELSLALWKFQKAMEELGHANKVTTFTMSDFGRKLQTNVNGGTDHAWGGHQIVMGGDGLGATGNFKGGQLFGTLPDLRPGGVDDYKYNAGHIIPTISQDQVSATVSSWFGGDATLISTIFPNLANFETTPGVIESAYLNLYA